MRIIGISGSLRVASTNAALLEALARNAPEGIEIEVQRGLGDLPIFNPDREGEGTPAVVRAWAGAVEEAHGLVIACPEYAHGIPGGLKNALDWLVSRFEIPGKPVMLAHGSHRGEYVLDALSEVLRTMSVRLVDEAFVRVPLVGKSPDEVAAILHSPQVERTLRRALQTFRSATTDASYSR